MAFRRVEYSHEEYNNKSELQSNSPRISQQQRTNSMPTSNSTSKWMTVNEQQIRCEQEHASNELQSLSAQWTEMQITLRERINKAGLSGNIHQDAAQINELENRITAVNKRRKQLQAFLALPNTLQYRCNWKNCNDPATERRASFGRRDQVEKHIRDAHENNMNIRCRYAQCWTNQRDNTDKYDRPYRFKSEDSYRYHLQNYHNERDPKLGRKK